jgi:hypothetical protein
MYWCAQGDRVYIGAKYLKLAGAAYVTRTRDPIITNCGYPRFSAVFWRICGRVSVFCALFVRVSSHEMVHMNIGRRGIGTPAPP